MHVFLVSLYICNRTFLDSLLIMYVFFMYTYMYFHVFQCNSLFEPDHAVREKS